MYGKPNVTQKLTVTTSTPVTISTETDDGIPLVVPMVVTAIPGSGGTLTVEYQVAEDGGVWQTWPGGAAATTTTYVLTGPVYALKFTAAVANGSVEIGQ